MSITEEELAPKIQKENEQLKKSLNELMTQVRDIQNQIAKNHKVMRIIGMSMMRRKYVKKKKAESEANKL